MSLPPLVQIETQDPRVRQLWRIVAVGWGAWAVASLGVIAWLGVVGIGLSVVVLAGLGAVLVLYLHHRTQVENFQHYRQLEALQALFALIDLRMPLPPMRLWVISPDFATLLVGLIREHQPRLVVELGSGVSTLVSGYSLELLEGGRVVSFEHIETFADSSSENISRHQLEAVAQVRYAPLRDMALPGWSGNWYDATRMDDLAGIDLLVVDGPPDTTSHLARYPALPMLFERLNPGAIILLDDCLRHDEQVIVNRWLSEFPVELVGSYGNEKGAVVLMKTPRP